MFWVSGLIVWLKFLQKPERRVSSTASSNTLLKAFTAEYVDVGGGRLLNLSLKLAVKEGQSARLNLVQVQLLRIGELLSTYEIFFSRWSELSAWGICQSTAVARCAELSEISGE